MPGKINPVIPEYIVSASHKVYSNDLLTSSLCGQGTLELNAYLPVIGNSIIESLKLLISSDQTLLENLLSGLTINESAGYTALMKSPSLTTALVPTCGYNKASDLARLMKEKNIDIFEANRILGIVGDKKLRKILEPGNLLKLGFSLDDLREE
jgi:aspartate ammonia-lyase